MKYLYIFAVLTLTACSDAALQTELEKTKSALKAAEGELAELKEDESGQITHLVFFKLKPDADTEALIAEIKKLAAIEGLKDLEVGPFKNLGDKRALSDYDVVMEMSFDNIAAYQKYQAHPVHLALKERAKLFLAGPPVTYDYLKK